jgi:hypothetical protein
MADVPYPLSATTIPELRRQIGELIRQLFEDKIGGAEIGDVFTLGGEVLQLALKTDGGLDKENGELKVKAAGTGYTITNKRLTVP